jgi:hypothetical protein
MKRFVAGVVLLAFVVACQQQTPQSPNSGPVLGRLELGFDAGATDARGDLRSQSLVPGANLPFSRTVALSKTYDATNNRYFWWVRYEFTNNTSAALNNVVLMAYNKSGNAAGSALGNLRDATSGTALSATAAETFVRKARPTNPMQGAPLVVSNASADLQLFSEAETTTLQTEASSDTSFLSSGETLLPYGFALHQSRSDRSIAPGETAVVNLALSIPDAGSASNYAFNMSFIAFENPLGIARVSESIEEQGSSSGVRSRAAELGAGVTVNAVQGTALLSNNTTPVTILPNVRIAINQNALKEVTVSSTADSGAGSLRDAIANLGADGIINFSATGSGFTPVQIKLESALVIDRKVILNLEKSGNTPAIVLAIDLSQTRAFEIGSGGYLHLQSRASTVTESLSFYVLGRTTSGDGGCVYNSGTLVIRGISFVDCQTISDDAGQPDVYGGAIYNAAVLRVELSLFTGNSVSGYGGADGADAAQAGAVGSTGENGGNGYGGVIYNSGSFEIQNSLFEAGRYVNPLDGSITGRSNKALGGNGGTGGSGWRAGTSFTTRGGAGGNGGSGYGGVIYSTNAFVQRDLKISLATSTYFNGAVAGKAGPGGRGTPNGSSGTIGLAFSGSTAPAICIANGSGGCL